MFYFSLFILRQEALITAIEGDKMRAQIICQDACAACKAKSMCGVDRKKEITLMGDDRHYAVGQHLTLEVSRNAGLMAVMWAYLIPVAIILGVLLLMQSLGYSDLTAGLTALGVMGVYYILIKILDLGGGVSITIIE